MISALRTPYSLYSRARIPKNNRVSDDALPLPNFFIRAVPRWKGPLPLTTSFLLQAVCPESTNGTTLGVCFAVPVLSEQLEWEALLVSGR